MPRLLRACRIGQAMFETTLLLGAITVALVIFFTFMRNSVSYRLKGGADSFGHGMLHNGNWVTR